MLLSPPTQINAIVLPLNFVVTVPSANIDSDLTDFPLMVDLEDMPSSFWDEVQEDGGNVRAFNGSGTSLIPHDLTYIDTYNKKGRMFIKTDLSSVTNTSVRVVVLKGNGNFLPLLSNDPNGRTSVWSDFETVVVYPNTIDRTGNHIGSFTSGNESHSRWNKQGFISLPGAPHQGVTTDGTNFWSVDTNEFYRMDMSFNLINSDTDIATSLAAAGGPTISHLGDPVVVGNRFFSTATHSRSGGGNYHRYILEYEADTLTFVKSTEIGDTGANTNHEFGATVCYDGTYLVLFSYTDGSKFRRYTLDGVYVDEVTLSVNQGGGIQGSTVLPNGNFLVSNDNGDDITEIEPDGTVLGIVYRDPHGSINEGLEYDETTDTLYCHLGDGDMVILKTDVRTEDWAYHHFDNSSVPVNNASKTFTLSGSHKWLTGGTDTQGEFFGLTDGAYLSYDEGPDFLGTWISGLTWLHSTKNPIYNEIWRGAIRYEEGVSRAIYIDGIKSEQIDAGVTTNLGATSNLVISDIDLQVSQQFIWLRNEVMSDDWMKADYDNMNDPANFYSVTAG